jgi:hypothetical protein
MRIYIDFSEFISSYGSIYLKLLLCIVYGNDYGSRHINMLEIKKD